MSEKLRNKKSFLGWMRWKSWIIDKTQTESGETGKKKNLKPH